MPYKVLHGQSPRMPRILMSSKQLKTSTASSYSHAVYVYVVCLSQFTIRVICLKGLFNECSPQTTTNPNTALSFSNNGMESVNIEIKHTTDNCKERVTIKILI